MFVTGAARLPLGENRLGDLIQIAAPDLLSKAAKQERLNACYYIDKTTCHPSIERVLPYSDNLAHDRAAFRHSSLACISNSGGGANLKIPWT